MVTRFRLLTLVILVLGGLFAFGCAPAPKKVAIFLDPAFSPASIDPVYVLPIVDARKDRTKQVDLESEFHNDVVRGVSQYKYTVLPVATGGPALDPRQVAEMTPEELAALGPANARTVLAVFVNDVSEIYVVMGYTYKVEMTAMLIDKQSKKMVWKDKGVGSAGQGGLISGAMAPMCKGEAKSACTGNMFASFPEVPKPAK